MFSDIAFYQIFGKPFVLLVGIATFTSFFITAMLGINFLKGWLKIRFKWHPTMVVISFSLAIIMTILGITIGSPIRILGILTLSSFLITAMLGITIHQRWLNIRFKWHPTLVAISFSLATIHAFLGISILLSNSV